MVDAVSFLNVGQGACVLMASSGASAVVDCPPDGSSSAVTYLSEVLGNPNPPLVIASHRDLDHVGGLAAIIRACGASALMLNRSYGLPTDATRKAKVKAVLRDLFDLIEELSVPYLELSRGQELHVGDLVLKCLWPSQHAINLGTTGWNANRTSLVIRVESSGGAFLVTGDLVDSEVWDFLLREDDLHVDVLMLPHHGGQFPRVAAVLEASDPEHCVFSYGRNNPYEHPNEDTLNTCALRPDARVLCTQVSQHCHSGPLEDPKCAGTVRFDIKDGGLHPHPSVRDHQRTIDQLSSPRSRPKTT